MSLLPPMSSCHRVIVSSISHHVDALPTTWGMDVGADAHDDDDDGGGLMD